MVFFDCSGRFVVSFGAAGNIEAHHAVAQGMAADFQLVGGAAEVEAILLEGGSDELALEIGDRVVEGLAARGLGKGGFMQAGLELEIGKAGGLYFGGGFEDERAFDDV